MENNNLISQVRQLKLPFEETKNKLYESYSPCGLGEHSIVFNGDLGEVIKLHVKKDISYVMFIKWVMELGNEAYLKHFPKVLYYTEEEDYIIVVMEKLIHHFDLATYEQERLHVALCPENVGVAQALDIAKQRFTYAMNCQRGRQYMFKNWERFIVIPSLEDAMQALLLSVYNTAWAVDLHSENIMFRRDENGICAVIIDPFTYY